MILTCPECHTRYSFDESRVPERGVPVRCKKCHSVFRAFRDGRQAQAGSPRAQAGAPAPHAAHSVRAQKPAQTAPDADAIEAGHDPSVTPPAGPQSSTLSETTAVPVAAPSAHAATQRQAADAVAGAPIVNAVEPSLPVQEGPADPVTVVTPGHGAADPNIVRLTRIILSDIVIYGPAKAEQAIRAGKFLEQYRSEIEEGRRVIRTRFPANASAVETFDRSLKELLDVRRKEMLEGATAP